MFQQFFRNSELLIFPVVGLIIFFLSFVGVLAYVFIGLRNKDKVRRIASLPLEGDDGPAALGPRAQRGGERSDA